MSPTLCHPRTRPPGGAALDGSHPGDGFHRPPGGPTASRPRSQSWTLVTGLGRAPGGPLSCLWAALPSPRGSERIPSSGSWFPSPWLSISSVHTLPSGILSRHFVGERQTETSGRASVITRDQPYKAGEVPPVTLEPSKGPQLSLHPGGEPRGLSPGLRGTWSPLRAALPLPCEGGTGQLPITLRTLGAQTPPQEPGKHEPFAFVWGSRAWQLSASREAT